MTIITVSTVGFQEVRPLSEGGRIFTSMLIISSFGTFAYAITSNNTTSQNMLVTYQEKLKDARFVDSTEGYNVNPDNGMTDVVGADTFINSRY